MVHCHCFPLLHSWHIFLQLQITLWTYNSNSCAIDNPSFWCWKWSDTDTETANEWHTFCPVKHHDTLVQIMEQHFCAHPLIPEYSAPMPEGIKAWAVRQIYEFFTLRDLPNLWAYLWENWYQHRRWELWEHSGNPGEIPHLLKTTMLVEAQ